MLLYGDFTMFFPNNCANITIRFNNSKSTMEEAFSKVCNDFIKNFTVHVTFETLTFAVRKPSRIRNVCLLRYKEETSRSNLFLISDNNKDVIYYCFEIHWLVTCNKYNTYTYVFNATCTP